MVECCQCVFDCDISVVVVCHYVSSWESDFFSSVCSHVKVLVNLSFAVLHFKRKINCDFFCSFRKNDFYCEIFCYDVKELMAHLSVENVHIMIIAFSFNVILWRKWVPLIPSCFPTSHDWESRLNFEVNFVWVSISIWGWNVSNCIYIVKGMSKFR